MSSSMHIELRQLRFRGYHGLYPEEQITGNEFEVNVSLEFNPGDTPLTELSATINYAAVYDTVKSQMQKREDLLETWLMKLCEVLYSQFPIITSADVSISKLQVPVGGFSGGVVVRYEKRF